MLLEGKCLGYSVNVKIPATAGGIVRYNLVSDSVLYFTREISIGDCSVLHSPEHDIYLRKPAISVVL